MWYWVCPTPHAEQVASATTLATSTGSTAWYCNRPITSTSIAKIAPANGVPKTEPNPAATPAISNTGRSPCPIRSSRA